MTPLLWLAALLAPESPYLHALPGYRYAFPRDHFEHPRFRTEWWYYTGNLQSKEGRRFGFELVFFRQAQRRGVAVNRSAWRVDDLYLAHAAVSDLVGNRFQYDKRLNRAGPGLAGARFDQQRVWNGNWSARWSGERQTLEAVSSEFRFQLELVPQKPAVIHGAGGVSQKAEGPGKASHYVSFTRLAAQGSLSVKGRTYSVEGFAWMDHEWFTHQLESTQVGWDWFSAQFDDGTELMLFQLRRAGGDIDRYSSGTFVDARGRARHLKASEFALEPLERWTSAANKAQYPVKWRIRVAPPGIDTVCEAALVNQEIPSEGSGPSYWEGAVSYRGSHAGTGYLEMTGYDKPVKLD